MTAAIAKGPPAELIDAEWGERAAGKRACKTCAAELGHRNKSGYCTRCFPVHGKAADHGQRVRDGIKRKIAADPAFAADLRSRARALALDPELVRRRTEHFAASELWKLSYAAIGGKGSPARLKAGRAISERRLAHIPVELRAERERLIRSKRMTAAEADAIILGDHEAKLARLRGRMEAEASASERRRRERQEAQDRFADQAAAPARPMDVAA